MSSLCLSECGCVGWCCFDSDYAKSYICIQANVYAFVTVLASLLSPAFYTEHCIVASLESELG